MAMKFGRSTGRCPSCWAVFSEIKRTSNMKHNGRTSQLWDICTSCVTHRHIFTTVVSAVQFPRCLNSWAILLPPPPPPRPPCFVVRRSKFATKLDVFSSYFSFKFSIDGSNTEPLSDVGTLRFNTHLISRLIKSAPFRNVACCGAGILYPVYSYRH